MGLRISRTIALIPGLLHLNISKSGVGVSIGPPGCTVSIGPRGVRQTLGVPGSGVSWVSTRSWTKRRA
jgi:Protein of unknown function (DUF4236)